MSYILGVKWLGGYSEVGDHEVYSICYILRKNTNNKTHKFCLVFTKVYFTLKEHQKTLNMLKNDFFFNWDSLHPKLSSCYKVWCYKKKKHKKIKLSRKSI